MTDDRALEVITNALRGSVHEIRDVSEVAQEVLDDLSSAGLHVFEDFGGTASDLTVPRAATHGLTDEESTERITERYGDALRALGEERDPS